MAGFTGPKTLKENGNSTVVLPTESGIKGLIAGGVSVAGGYQVGDILECLSLADAEAAGLTASYDTTNGILVHYHIDEYFRNHATGKLYVLLVAQGMSMTNMVDVNTANAALSLIRDESVNREITTLGVVLNPDMTTYVATTSNGIDEDVLTAIPKAQELVDTLQGQFIYLEQVYLEGRQLDTTIANVPDFRTLGGRNVSVIGGQDPAIASLDPAYAHHAAVGSALGMKSIRQIQENLGSVDINQKPDALLANESYPLTSAARGRWLSANLSSGTAFNDLNPNEEAALDDKGLIYVGRYEGYPGYYFNDAHNCISLSDDYPMNEHNSVWATAAKGVRRALLPKTKSNVQRDPSTGFLRPEVIAYWQQVAFKPIQDMINRGEISGGDVYIEPNQSVDVGSELKIRVRIVTVGVARSITNYIGIVPQIS